jgi:conjugal transfer/entry exclusion protein
MTHSARIITETPISRVYEKRGEFYISQKFQGTLRRLRVTQADADYFSKGIANLDRMLDTVLNIVRERNDPDYYQTKTED